MMQITIPAEVVNGHLQHEQDLGELEGQKVIVNLTIAPNGSANGIGEKTAEQDPNAEFDPEPPPWLDVEQDLYFPITAPEILLEKKPLTVERGTPSMILPEDLPND